MNRPIHDAQLPAERVNRPRQRVFPALAPLYARGEPVMYALLRAMFGIILLTHGLPKALGTSHGSMANPMEGSINLIQNVLGLPFASELAFLVMLLETLGALMLTVGLWVRPVALIVALEMIGISCALGPTWPWVDRGIEYPVLMTFLALYIALRGSGRLALDRLVKYTF